MGMYVWVCVLGEGGSHGTEEDVDDVDGGFPFTATTTTITHTRTSHTHTPHTHAVRISHGVCRIRGVVSHHLRTDLYMLSSSSLDIFTYS